MPSMKDYQSKVLAPGWLQDEWGRAWLESFGSEKDALAALAKEAVKARFPAFKPGRGPRSNLLVRSQQLEYELVDGASGPAAWYRGLSATVTGNAAIAPDGTMTAAAIVYDGTPNHPSQLVQYAFDLAPDGSRKAALERLGQPYTASIWLASDTPVRVAISNGIETDMRKFAACDLTPAWQRFSHTCLGREQSGMGFRLESYFNPSTGYEWTPFSIRAWGAMLDESTNLGPYLPTTDMPIVGRVDDDAVFATADAVALLGHERGIDRGLTEDMLSYRRRVRAAWDIWRWAGTPYGLLLALYWAGYTPRSGRVLLQVQKGVQYELRPDFDPDLHDASNALIVSQMPGTVHLGGSPELWSQFAVIITQPWPSRWATAPADGSDDQKAVAQIVGRWKPGHAKCVRLQVQGSGPIVGSGLTVGSFTVGSGAVTTWTPPSN